MVLAVGQGELDQGYSGPVRVTVVLAVGQGGLGQGYSGSGCRTGWVRSGLQWSWL